MTNFAESKLHGIHGEGASLIRENVPYLPKFLIDGTRKHFALLKRNRLLLGFSRHYTFTIILNCFDLYITFFIINMN